MQVSKFFPRQKHGNARGRQHQGESCNQLLHHLCIEVGSSQWTPVYPPLVLVLLQ